MEKNGKGASRLRRDYLEEMVVGNPQDSKEYAADGKDNREAGPVRVVEGRKEQ